MFEYNTWRTMTMLDGGDITGNFQFDDAGQPLSTASGNMPDYEDVRHFLDSVIEQGEQAADEIDWRNKIQNCVESWLTS